MGQDVSSTLRSRLENSTLEKLLDEDEVVQALEQYPIPEKMQRNLARILKSSSQTKISFEKRQLRPFRDRLGPLWGLQAKDFSITQDTLGNLLRFGIGQSSNGVDPLPPSNHYQYTRNIRTALSVNRVIWRFLTTFYSDVILELGNTRRRLSNPDHAGVALVVGMICGGGEHDRTTVEQDVKAWAETG
ncbi:hypothetical protein ONS95_011640 [Cadophora gregata]|uniref:uncharacterized protein n=1 Tax=Cadophora gregata TaxID=51156 RepID=UPI0026DB1311|nr:uncharacterized protein ONS95_011640 [Cadophora gregata]KAK0120234.1 hypothetical protein ONS95_011640 [Cadophora gregata]KAK0121270.1 hypothetical protein ONS96_011445 [Cadophora gregata f. sp. sojae]